MAKSTAYKSDGRRKYPKKCTLTIYHTGSVFLLIGILLAIIGIAAPRLFHVYIYDHRKPARFLNLHVPVGLFSSDAEMTKLTLEKEPLQHSLELTDGRWITAQTITLIGLLAAIASFIFHWIISCCRAQHSWSTVIFEVFGLLLAVAAILIGLSLAESEIEYIHDHGDSMLADFLSANDLLLDNGPAIPVPSGLSPAGYSDGSKEDFALFLTPPRMGFALLIASDFLILIAFLAVLIYFVRLCEKAVQTRKQMRSAEVSHA